ncbi:MAG: hypothetical protein ACRD50_16250 [Candidatus Acidiferrales bacterium]
MAERRINPRWFMLAGGLALLVYLGYASWQAMKVSYEVCMNFRGNTHCAQARGTRAEDAIRNAQEIDCQLLSSGRDENMVCLDTQPSSVRNLSSGDNR